jgi:predicted regulator of Ras-like GTPase activity (Roadblock/LC7/MglB family)
LPPQISDDLVDFQRVEAAAVAPLSAGASAPSNASSSASTRATGAAPTSEALSSATPSIKSAAGAPTQTATAGTEAPPPIVRVTRSVLDPARAKRALAGMASLDGMLGCAVVDSTTGLVLARESRDDTLVDMDLAAAACAQMLRAHRRAARSMGLPEQIDELMTSAGPRQQIIRTVTRHPDLFLVVLLDKHRTNLALARYQLMEVERAVD